MLRTLAQKAFRDNFTSAIYFAYDPISTTVDDELCISSEGGRNRSPDFTRKNTHDSSLKRKNIIFNTWTPIRSGTGIIVKLVNSWCTASIHSAIGRQHQIQLLQFHYNMHRPTLEITGEDVAFNVHQYVQTRDENSAVHWILAPLSHEQSSSFPGASASAIAINETTSEHAATNTSEDSFR